MDSVPPPTQEQAEALIQNRLEYSFSDAAHLADALTHRSFRNEHPKLARRDNERLEFLGDAILGLSASELLFERFPKASEGELTRHRSAIVCEASFAEIAKGLELHHGLRLGKGEQRTGGRDNPRLLASAFEALIGAIWRDAGHEAAVRIAKAQLTPRIGKKTPVQDHKSAYQEHIQAKEGITPKYEVVETAGPDHAREFTVEVRVGSDVRARAKGRSKASAAQAAAKIALEEE